MTYNGKDVTHMSQAKTNIQGALGVGQVLTANANTIAAASFSANVTVPPVATVDGDANIDVKAEGKLTITDADGNVYDVLEFMKTVSDRMLVLHPDFKKHEQYPALKEAYEHYKFLEDLMLTGNKDSDG